MAREREALGYSLLLLLVSVVSGRFERCNAAARAGGFTVVGNGVASARTVVCTGGGSDVVVPFEETLAHDESSFSSFTLKCKGTGFVVLPDSAEQGLPLVCTENSTVDSCTQISLDALGLTASVGFSETATEKVVQWKVEPRGFPRYPQKLKVGCVKPKSIGGRTGKVVPHGRGIGGCLITLVIPPAPPSVENNVADCTYAKKRTVTPEVSVTADASFVSIRCGSGASVVPSDGRYCSSENVDKCTPRSLTNILPKYTKSWWGGEKGEVTLTVPVEHLPSPAKKVYFGCVLPGRPGASEKKEDYYCAVPVRFHSAAPHQWSVTLVRDGAGWWFTLLLALSSCGITHESFLN